MATDTETPQASLTYNIFMGTGPLGMETVTPMADTGNGYRKIVAMGNMQLDTSWIIDSLAEGDYAVFVQAVDETLVVRGQLGRSLPIPAVQMNNDAALDAGVLNTGCVAGERGQEEGGCQRQLLHVLPPVGSLLDCTCPQTAAVYCNVHRTIH